MTIPSCLVISSSSLPVKKQIVSTLVTGLLMSLLVTNAWMALNIITETKGIVMPVLISLRLSNSKFSKFARSARFLIHKIWRFHRPSQSKRSSQIILLKKNFRVQFLLLGRRIHATTQLRKNLHKFDRTYFNNGWTEVMILMKIPSLL